MNLSRFPRRTLAAGLLLAAAGHAPASGNHAGGHGPDAGIGEPGEPARVSRTVEVTMNDAMRFVPERIRVRRGETVRFAVRNVGQLKHEFVLGTERELKAHYEQMKRFPGMEHEEPNMVSLPAGGQGEVVWRFTRAGTVHFACLQVGHYEAGMKGRVQVAGQPPVSTNLRKSQ